MSSWCRDVHNNATMSSGEKYIGASLVHACFRDIMFCRFMVAKRWVENLFYERQSNTAKECGFNHQLCQGPTNISRIIAKQNSTDGGGCLLERQWQRKDKTQKRQRRQRQGQSQERNNNKKTGNEKETWNGKGINPSDPSDKSFRCGVTRHRTEQRSTPSTQAISTVCVMEEGDGNWNASWLGRRFMAK